jgi:hypothetical protein
VTLISVEAERKLSHFPCTRWSQSLDAHFLTHLGAMNTICRPPSRSSWVASRKIHIATAPIADPFKSRRFSLSCSGSQSSPPSPARSFPLCFSSGRFLGPELGKIMIDKTLDVASVMETQIFSKVLSNFRVQLFF